MKVVDRILGEADEVSMSDRWHALMSIDYANPSEKEKFLDLIAGHPAVAYNYALKLGRRFTKGEAAILSDSRIAKAYAKMFFGGVNKWPEANKVSREFLRAHTHGPGVSAPLDVVEQGLLELNPRCDPHHCGGQWTPFHQSLVFLGSLTKKIASFLKKCNWVVVPHTDETNAEMGHLWYEWGENTKKIVHIVPLYQGKGGVDTGGYKTFHVTPTANEKSILSKGLSGRFLINQHEFKGYKRTYLFLANSADSLSQEALSVNEMLWRNYDESGRANLIKYGFTVLEVDVSGLEIFADLNMADGNWVHTPNVIGPGKIRVVSRTGPIKTLSAMSLMYPKEDLVSAF